MKIVRNSNYLPAGTVVSVKRIKDWDHVGVVIHPASLSKDVEVQGYIGIDPFMEIVRTAARYYRLDPSEEVEVLYEPVDCNEFKPKETMLYPINKPTDY